jgi:hypothetical protein
MAVHLDSVSSSAEVAFVVSMPTKRVTGTVNSFRVQNSGRGAAVPLGLALPFPFVGTYSERGQQLSFIAPSASPCVTPALPVAHSLRDLWFQAPDTLQLGSTWDDSASYTNCRDGVLLRTAVWRTFRVTAASERGSRMLLTLSRSSRTTFEGTGTQAGEPVTITGSGTGEIAYTVDSGAGAILAARGSSTLELTLRSKLRMQGVRQVSDIRIDRSP